MICTFKTNYAGLCGHYAPSGRCDKHKDKTEKPKRDLIGKTRGKSNWYPESKLIVK